MKIPIYQIDAFSATVFGGNPAAVCPLENWMEDSILQKIAAENNLSETAFFVKEKERYQIRWFTPTIEIELCGHATLASAYVIFNYLAPEISTINFYSPLSGTLTVHKETDGYTLDFPANPPKPTDTPKYLVEAIHKTVVACWETKGKLLVLLSSQKEVEQLKPDFSQLAKVEKQGIVFTALGDKVDFVSRCFFPRIGINEDPVTGSAHTLMIPFWAKRLGRDQLQAIQVSARRGHLKCALRQDRVSISGQACLYMKGEIELNI